MHPECLPDAQVQHDLLRSTGNGVGADVAVQSLDLFGISIHISTSSSKDRLRGTYFGALPTTRVTQSTKDLTGLPGTEFERHGRLSLQPSNSTTQLQHGLGLVHDIALINQILHPVVGSLDLSCHMGELETDDGMVDELLAEGLALVGVFDGLFVADAREADALDYYANALVVEVCHDD